jgi:hypothetical protein
MALVKKSLLILLAAVAWVSPALPGIPGKEYQVKAVFLYNFTQFVEWPAASFPEAKAPLVVGVLGGDPFKDYLDEVVRGEKAGVHPIVVKHYRKSEEVRDCQVLFVSASDAGLPDSVLAALRTRNILTVSDAEGFCKRGGIVNFVTRNGKIRLLVNLEAAKAAGLTLSSKLLRISELVGAGEG